MYTNYNIPQNKCNYQRNYRNSGNSFDYGMIMGQFAQESLLDVAVTDAEVDKCFE